VRYYTAILNRSAIFFVYCPLLGNQAKSKVRQHHIHVCIENWIKINTFSLFFVSVFLQVVVGALGINIEERKLFTQ